MRHVTRFFENPGFVRALTNVSLEIRRGEIFGILGPKGSGKSTALKILSGNMSASEGKAKVFGRSPRRRSVKSRIGYLPQGAGSPTLNLFAKVLSLFLRLLANGHAETGIHPALITRRRHATLAQILAKAPDLIILDEPFFGMDAASCAELKELFLALVRRGRTIILSSDSLSESKDVCNRIAVLYAGTVQATGTLPELLVHPEAIRFTAPLLPPTTADSVLGIIRRDMLTSTPCNPAPQPDCILKTDHAVAQQSRTNDVLSPLLKKEVSLSVEPKVSSMGIDHDILASLTRRVD